MKLDDKIKQRIKSITTGCYNNYVLQLDKVCQELNLPCFDAQFEDPKISGAIYPEDGVCTIYINSKHPLTRRRFTVAHEIGHYISAECGSYSKEQLDNTGFQDYAISFRQEGVSSQAETEANMIAAEMLMPEESVNKLYTLGVSPEQMAEEFCVSEIAIKIRLEKLYPNVIFD